MLRKATGKIEHTFTLNQDEFMAVSDTLGNKKKEIKEHRMRSSKMNVIEITKDNSESWEAMFKEMIVKAFENWSRIFSDWN